MLFRSKRILKRTVSAMQYQLKKGSFVPEKFEVSFSVLEELDETGKVWFYLNRTWCFHGMAIYVDSKRGTRTEEKYI